MASMAPPLPPSEYLLFLFPLPYSPSLNHSFNSVTALYSRAQRDAESSASQTFPSSPPPPPLPLLNSFTFPPSPKSPHHHHPPTEPPSSPPILHHHTTGTHLLHRCGNPQVHRLRRTRPLLRRRYLLLLPPTRQREAQEGTDLPLRTLTRGPPHRIQLEWDPRGADT